VTEPAADLIILEPTEMALPHCELGEGPHWDIPTQALYWVDIPARRAHRRDADGAHTTWDVGLPVGAVVPRESGGLCVAAGNAFYALDTETGEVTEIAPAPGLPRTRLNDGKCDREGRFYAGSMDNDEAPGRGTFYRLNLDHTVTEIFPRVGLSNGLGWSPDDRLMYYIDSLAYQVDMMDYNPETGEMGDRRPFACLGSAETVPDGMTVDAEGGVWVAVWGGGVIQRYEPDGKLSGVVRLPAAFVTSCAFGGPELDQLFITTATGPGRSGGALFTCPAGVKGLPAYRYRG
jgi:sugar lactone lactonase YvrE